MEIANLWDEWSDIHSSPDQVKRQKSACGSKLTPLSIDTENCSGTFKGTKTDYQTSLIACTCIDYSRRRKPCKHMYRLAYELNLFDLFDEVSSDQLISSRLRIDDAMKVITSFLSKDEALHYANLCYCCGSENKTCLPYDVSFADKLISHNLAEEETRIEYLLCWCHINDIRKLLPPGSPRPRTKLGVMEIVAPLITHEQVPLPPDTKYVHLHPFVVHLASSMHRRIHLMYPDKLPESFFLDAAKSSEPDFPDNQSSETLEFNSSSAADCSEPNSADSQTSEILEFDSSDADDYPEPDLADGEALEIPNLEQLCDAIIEALSNINALPFEFKSFSYSDELPGCIIVDVLTAHDRDNILARCIYENALDEWAVLTLSNCVNGHFYLGYGNLVDLYTYPDEEAVPFVFPVSSSNDTFQSCLETLDTLPDEELTPYSPDGKYAKAYIEAIPEFINDFMELYKIGAISRPKLIRIISALICHI